MMSAAVGVFTSTRCRSWTRNIVVPTQYLLRAQTGRVCARRGNCRVVPGPAPDAACPSADEALWLTWTNSSSAWTRRSNGWNAGVRGSNWVRGPAFAPPRRWMLDHFADSDGVGDHLSADAFTHRQLALPRFMPTIENERSGPSSNRGHMLLERTDTVAVQPCFPRSGDTASCAPSPGDGGWPHAAQGGGACRAIGCSTRGAKARRTGVSPTKDLETAGWFFEYRNGFLPRHRRYGDAWLMALARTGTRPARPRRAIPRLNADCDGCAACRTKDGVGPRSNRDHSITTS